MEPMRNALLWASENQTLKDHVPRWPFVQRALRKFMPGETLEDAIGAARNLAGRGVTTTFSTLGEHVTTLYQAEGVTEEYLGVYDRIAELGLDAEVAVKLTHLGLDLDTETTIKNVEQLAARAEETGTWLWIDMESSEYVDPTFDVYKQVRSVHAPVGVCVQAYLHRTPQDLEDLLPLEPGIRLVKGAYKEPASVSIHKHADVDDAFFRIGADLLTKIGGGLRLALATHDVALLDRMGVVAKAAGISNTDYEIQMLYGIRMEDQLRYGAEGYDMRTVIPYGEEWYPWYVRRLAERPANLWHVARNAFAKSPV